MTAVGEGYCLALGGTNAREALCVGNEIQNFKSEATPATEDEFFTWMSRRILGAADAGAEWVVVGVPGPAREEDGEAFIGPMDNVQGLRERTYNLNEWLAKADPGMAQVIKEGFKIIAVNDGDLAAHAVAKRLANEDEMIVGALINGTGVGFGAAQRVSKGTDNFSTLKLLFEVGHIPEGSDPLVTFEKTISGTALRELYGMEAKDMPVNHPGWERVGVGMGRLVSAVGLMASVDLVVPTGGVGSNAYDKYASSLHTFLDVLHTYGNGVQKLYTPRIAQVPPEDRDAFEMYGAHSVAQSML